MCGLWRLSCACDDMKELIVTLAIPYRKRPNEKVLAKRLAEVIEEHMAEVPYEDFLSGDERTMADHCGIGDCVATLTVGKTSVEITL